MEGHLSSGATPPPIWATALTLPPPHTIESLDAPIPLHRGVGANGKTVGTVPITQVSVLTESTDNNTMVISGCAEVWGGHKGQSWGWSRRGLQEVDHEGHRGAQCRFTCRGGGAELARALVRAG